MEWTERPGPELTAAELHAILELRTAVFVVEQDCPYQDIDGRDLEPGVVHLWAAGERGIAAYARLRPPHEGSSRIGRVVVAPHARGRGLGHDLLRRSVERCARRWPDADIVLAAQSHLQDYYGHAGFRPFGEEYLEDGIPHVDMWRPRA